MKSIPWVLVFCVALFPATLPAQFLSNWGVKTAVTRSTLDIDQFHNFASWRTGMNLAVYAEHHLWKFFAITPQLEYAQKGYIAEQVETSETGTTIQQVQANTRLDYVSVPLFLKLTYPTETLTPFVAVGPRMDYLAHVKKGRFHFTEVTAVDPRAENFKSFALGGSFTGGVNIPVSTNSEMSVELRYNGDFTNSATDQVQYSLKNTTVDLWIGLAF